MGKTSIQWTEETWNPLRGCSVVSPGCTNCYAMRQAHRYSGKGMPYEGLTKLTRAGPVWTGSIKYVNDALTDPLRWKKPRRVFVNSMSDLFHESVPDSFIDKVFAVMAVSYDHTFQILTKRAQRMHDYVGQVDAEKDMQRWINAAHEIPGMPGDAIGYLEREVEYPLPNVWLGVSVEDQVRANERIPLLLDTPAAVHWISAEPLLDVVSLNNIAGRTRYMPPEHDHFDALRMGLDWVVIGGESGPSARWFQLAWARLMIGHCRGAGVPVFMKQLGTRPAGLVLEDRIPMDPKGGNMDEWPGDLRVREYPNA